MKEKLFHYAELVLASNYLRDGYMTLSRLREGDHPYKFREFDSMKLLDQLHAVEREAHDLYVEITNALPTPPDPGEQSDHCGCKCHPEYSANGRFVGPPGEGSDACQKCCTTPPDPPTTHHNP